MDAKCELPTPYALRRVAATAVVLLLIVVFLTSAAWAHAGDSDEDEDQGPVTRAANLTLQYDARGTAEVTLYTDSDVQDWSPIQTALEHSLHCPAGAFTHPKAQPFSSSSLGALGAKQRARFEDMATRQQLRTLHGSCQGAMARDGFMIYTGVTLGPVVAELGKIGEQQLHVSVTYQASKYARPIPFALRQAGNSQFQYSTYEFDVSDASSASLHLQFGLSRREALRAAALPITILLLPILIMLWMQFAAIRDAKQDPTAAWFSYFRSLNWCMNGVMLLWIVGNSVRRGRPGRLLSGRTRWPCNRDPAGDPYSSAVVCLHRLSSLFLPRVCASPRQCVDTTGVLLHPTVASGRATASLDVPICWD